MRLFVTRNFASYGVALAATLMLLIGPARIAPAQRKIITLAPAVVPVPAGAVPAKGDKKAKEADGE